VLVALVILSSAFVIIYTTFTTTMKAWRDGSTLLEDLRHGDFVLEQLVSALRSSAYFEGAGGYYGFRMEDKSAGRFPGDVLSWVTANPAFIPVDSPLARSMHRIEFTIDRNDEGDPAVAITAYTYLADEDEVDDAETWYISTEVQGFDVQFYDLEDEVWEDEWEDTNSVPSLIQVSLFMPPIEKYDDPVTLSRLIQIPVSREGISNPVTEVGAPGTSPSPAAGGSTTPVAEAPTTGGRAPVQGDGQ
jgi:hypothetical protein